MKFVISFLLLASSAFAADFAPLWLSGRSVIVVINSGSGYFADIGGARVTFTGSNFTLDPLSTNMNAESGTYTYKRYSATSADMVFTTSGISITYSLTFTGQSRANFSIISPIGNQAGTAYIEESGSPKLINISVRAVVPKDGNVIPGFVIEGSRQRVLIRAAGPGLAGFEVSGTLGDPKLDVYSGKTVIASNDDWSADSTNATQVTDAGVKAGAFAFKSGSKDAAIVLDLDPGAYTALVRGPAGLAGEVLIEVYRVQ